MCKLLTYETKGGDGGNGDDDDEIHLSDVCLSLCLLIRVTKNCLNRCLIIISEDLRFQDFVCHFFVDHRQRACDAWAIIRQCFQPVNTRNSSGDEIANVNFLCDDIVHALKYNRVLHKFRHTSFSATQVYQIQ